ncbi:MAG TPA: phosphoribosylaminoimidazolesuccinocarboxamide synthase [Gemmatimonadaceae bacterium]|nr:phosphoribosylaminoimidazolesuccinocarboxamide synthase [Gemmatimonadaceae bacterium]
MLVAETGLPLPLLRRGKVRDVYEVDAERLLLVATDRVSAFDVVMSETIPFKGAVLTQLTAWWLEQLAGLVRHHMLSADSEEIIRRLPQLAAHADELRDRMMLCVRAEVFPVECVIRGYIAGSALKEYLAHGTLAGEKLPPNVREAERLPVPLFSPATKAEHGHDENITISKMRELVGSEATAELERLTRLVYEYGRAVAGERGIIIADTKLEFGYSGSSRGFDPAEVILVDEVLTPDSSRFWPHEGFKPGRTQPSFDKQPLRDHLDGERRLGNWNGEHPAPPLPPDVVHATSDRYLEIFRRLTGAPLRNGPIH